MAGTETSKPPIFLIVAVILVLGGVIFALSRPAPQKIPSYTPKSDEKVASKDPTESKDPKKEDASTTPAPKEVKPATGEGNEGKKEDPRNPQDRNVLFTYLTRQGATYYQSSKRYIDVPIAFELMPGAREVAEVLAKQGRQIPPMVYLSQQDTETRVECLGQQTHTISSYCGYRHPTEGITMAYDVALTSGGVAQRMVGHLKPAGVQVDVYQGDQKVDEQEVKFPRSANIMPLDLSFIYQWYVADRAAANAEKNQERKPMRWLFFVPEVSGFVALTARPLGPETIAHRGQNRDCIKFEILTASTQALSGLVSKQEMWFDKSDGSLLRRQEVDDSNPGMANFTERAGVDDLKTLQPLVQRPPELPEAPFPYPFEKDLTYRIRSGEKQIGRVIVRYSKRMDEKGNFLGYRSNSSLDLSTESTTRKESTETRFDTKFLPLYYVAQGQETADVESNYRVSATFAGNRVLLTLLRDVVTPAPTPLTPTATKVKDNWDEPGVAHPQNTEGDWTPPLRMVKFVGDEIKDELPPPPKPRHQDEKLERPLTAGALIMDYHRVEHLALAAFRFPRPAWPKPGPDGSIAAFGSNFERRYQNTAFFSVRQNLTGIPQFAILPEHRAAKPLNAELDPDLKDLEQLPDDPPLFVAGTSHSMMPCAMLLDEAGRLLQLSMKYGAHEIIFTLDDPIMQRREEKIRVMKGQEGPTMIRPPWY